MKHDDLPARWRANISDYIRAFANVSREDFTAGDFPWFHSVRMTFEDGSISCFSCAILIEDHEVNEIGIFTERSGYHIFPLTGVSIEWIRG